MIVLYEDKDIVICKKESGFLSQMSQTQPSLAYEVFQKYGYAGVVHRLDLNVGGAIIYAKNKDASSHFSSLVSQRQIEKEYIAVVHGIPDKEEGIFEDLLFKDSSKNKTFVVKRLRKGVKEARLSYKLMETNFSGSNPLSLVKIILDTGRSHQIRVQFSSRKMPLAGDGKYGSKDNKCSISLWSHRISFAYRGKDVSVVSFPDKNKYPWNLFEFIKNQQ